MPISLHTIPPEDPIVYDMICEADTVGVFQIESRAQMTMLPRLRPRCYYDLVIEVAIVRPGPIQGQMVHPYLRRRNGEEPIEYPDDRVRDVLQKTLGVPLFQEQVMQLAIVAAGFTGGEADQLRRAIAAWKNQGHDRIAAFEQRFVGGMLERGYDPDFAQRCFNQIKGFGEYGFPESHAASFALLVYASCWLKRYHPAAFTAALINSQPMGFYAPAQLVRDAQDHGVEVRPVDVNRSGWDCDLEDWGRDAETKRRRDEVMRELAFDGSSTFSGEAIDGECEDVSRPSGVAEGDEIGGGGVSRDSSDARVGAIRLDQSDEAGRDVRTVEHRGGIWARESAGPVEVFSDRSRIAERSRDTTRTGRPTQADREQQRTASDDRGNRSRPPRPDSQPRTKEIAPEIEHSVSPSPRLSVSSSPALRLGLRLVKGLKEDDANRIAESVAAHGPFDSIEKLWRASGVSVAVLRRLAQADAFQSMGLDRQQALWQVRALKDEVLPLFDGEDVNSELGSGGVQSEKGEAQSEEVEAEGEGEGSHVTSDTARRVVAAAKQGEAGSPSSLFPLNFEHCTDTASADAPHSPFSIPDSELPPLPPIPAPRKVIQDYEWVGLSLKAHPISFLRGELEERGVIRAEELADEAKWPHGKWVRVAGLVLVRQRPSTASGIIFMTTEDETGVANLIVRPRIFERYRKAAKHGVAVVAHGKVERQGQVVHVMAHRFDDLSDQLAALTKKSRDFR